MSKFAKDNVSMTESMYVCVFVNEISYRWFLEAWTRMSKTTLALWHHVAYDTRFTKEIHGSF